MKSSQSSLTHGRQRVIAAAVALLASAAFVTAQTTSSPSTKPTDKSSSSSSTGSSSGSYQSDSTKSSTSASSTDASSTSPSSTSSSTSAGAPTGRSTSSDKLSWGDKRFVNKAADGGADEIALAKLAADKATNPEVKSFAQKLVDDHQMVATELDSLASQKNVKIDKDSDHDRAYKRLSKKTGAEFDQEFVEHMIDEHEKAVKMFDKAAKDAKDADIRSFASKHVEHLRDHLKTAEDLRQTIMPTGRSDTSGTTRSSSSSYDTSSSSTTPSSSSSSSTIPSDTSSTTPKSSSSSSSPDTSSSSPTPKR